MPEYQPITRRVCPRIRIKYRAHLRPLDALSSETPESGVACTTHDIGRGGLGLEVDRPFPTPCRVLVTFDNNSPDDMRLVARVGRTVWTQPARRPNRWMLGVKFEDEPGG